MRYAIEGETLTDMADAVRGLVRTDDAMTPAQMADAIEGSRLGVPFYGCDHLVNGRWVRPAGWPDLDALKAQIPEGESCVYLTYVLSLVDEESQWVGMYGYGGTWYAERGHVEGGAFVADESTSHASNQYHREVLDPANGDVQLWRFRSTANITRFGLASKTGTNAQNPATLTQPCVERAGKLPHATNLSSGCTAFNTAAYGSLCQVTYHTERDSVDYTGRVNNCSYTYSFGRSLVEIDMSGWDTAAWRPTRLDGMFDNCASLRSLDISGWQTGDWAPTTLANMFHSCFALTRLDMHGLDTSNWRPTTLAGLFYNCYSLQHLDMTGWDTSAWPVSVVSDVFDNCWSIETIDLSCWDTSAWPVEGSASALFYNCYALKELVMPDTSGWSPSTSRYLLNGSSSLRTCPLIDLHEPASCNYYGVPDGYYLRDYGGRARIDITHSYRNCVQLTHESLVSILTALPEVTNGVSIQLGPTNLLKLTDEDKAIATDKGWKVVS